MNAAERSRQQVNPLDVTIRRALHANRYVVVETRLQWSVGLEGRRPMKEQCLKELGESSFSLKIAGTSNYKLRKRSQERQKLVFLY